MTPEWADPKLELILLEARYIPMVRNISDIIKPDWKDAPIWAEWLAQDANGRWFWYGDRPTINESQGIWIIGKPRAMNCAIAMCAVITDQCKWKDSLEAKPQN